SKGHFRLSGYGAHIAIYYVGCAIYYVAVHGNQGKHRVTKRGPALSYPMFTLVTGIVGRWRAGRVAQDVTFAEDLSQNDHLRVTVLTFLAQYKPGRILITAGGWTTKTIVGPNKRDSEELNGATVDYSHCHFSYGSAEGKPGLHHFHKNEWSGIKMTLQCDSPSRNESLFHCFSSCEAHTAPLVPVEKDNTSVATTTVPPTKGNETTSKVPEPPASPNATIPTTPISVTNRTTTTTQAPVVTSASTTTTTTKAPVKTTSVNATTTISPVTSSISATLQKKSGFDVGSFVGGIVLTLGLLATVYFGCRFYSSKRGVRYRTILNLLLTHK
ncbi:unnamed protein product, partial [Ranitomeya imitator]